MPLIVLNIVRNGSLWGNAVFDKNRTFQEIIWINFETQRVSSRNQKNFVWLGFFFFHIIMQLRRPLELSYVIWCICWDTPSEKTGLWQLIKVSSVFKDLVVTTETPTHTLLIRNTRVWTIVYLVELEYRFSTTWLIVVPQQLQKKSWLPAWWTNCVAHDYSLPRYLFTQHNQTQQWHNPSILSAWIWLYCSFGKQ